MGRQPSEAQIQGAIVQYLRTALPFAVVHHSANEGNRGGIAGIKDGARKKALGQVAGFPDIIVLHWSKVGPLFFEVKSKKGKVSDAQKEMHEKLTALGYKVAVVRSVDDVEAALTEWGVGSSHPAKSEPPTVKPGVARTVSDG